jgi:hypothetical protein
MIAISPFMTLARLLVHLYAALRGRGASGKFSEKHSVLHALAIVIKAWYSALKSLPHIIRQRRAFSGLIRISRAEIYRLFCRFRISAFEVALKE